MMVIPAIDLRGGRCVRLVQGDYDRETIFDDDPIAVAKRWESSGAQRIHVVDLDGARSGVASQRDIIGRIASEVGVPVQVGGGVRNLADAAELLESGIERVIVGTAAIKQPEIVDQIVSAYGPQSLVVGIDARNAKVATDGWLETSEMTAADLIQHMRRRGVERIVYTDIDRDGTLTSPNFDGVARATGHGMAVIASGGVARRSDFDRLAAITGVEAVIVGRALYTNDIILERDEWVWKSSHSTEGCTS